MVLLILSRTREKWEEQRYRGTERQYPGYNSHPPPDHPANQWFSWFAEANHDFGIVYDLDRARKLVEAYFRLKTLQLFEIIEVIGIDEILKYHNAQFLGFDLSAGYATSLLSSGLMINEVKASDLADDAVLRTIKPILRLIREHFRPKLNENGLFDDRSLAEFCLECMLAMQLVRPSLWEADEVQFEVVGLWSVLPA